MEKKRLNNLVYMDVARIHAPDGNSARKTENKKDTGESVFPETDPISLFSGLLIYLLLNVETNGNFKVTWGSAVLTFIKIRCFI